MLLTLALWALMVTVIYAVGIGLVPPGTFSRVGDRIMAALWVGFVVVSNAWLALALFTPLTFWRTLGLTALGVAALWLYRRQRNREWTWLPKVDVTAVPPLLWLIGVLGLAGLALLAAQPVVSFDTGLYHSQAVKWIETYGVTPGIALLLIQLGYASSWYAFVAPFDIFWWNSRLGVVGGFPVILLYIQAWLAFIRAWLGDAQRSDWFVLLAGGLALLMVAHCGQMASLSTDVPTAVLIIATVWALLRTSENWETEMVVTAEADCRIRTVFVLAVGALTVKLSAIPVALMIFAWAGWQVRRTISEIILLVIATGLLLTPTTAARFVTSGYPFFPSRFSLYLPSWAYDSEKLAAIPRAVRDFARWVWYLPPGVRYSQGWFDVAWLPRWLGIETLMAVYLVLTLAAGLALWRHKNINAVSKYSTRWAIGLAWAGSAYVFAMAPTLRFAIGFLVILPALWLAQLLQAQATMPVVLLGGVVASVTFFGVFYERPLGYASLALVTGMALLAWVLMVWLRRTTWKLGASLVALLCLPMLLTTIRMRPKLYLLKPSVIPSQPTIIVTINNVVLYRPLPPPGQYALCWDSQLPCGYDDIDPDITLRNPKQGTAGGFKRSTRAK